MSLVRFVYASADTRPFTSGELSQLLLKARANNSTLGITGLLLYHKRSFFQVLEGEEEAVMDLFLRIEQDPRHQRVLLLSKEEVKERSFGAWKMGFVDIGRCAADLPGFVKLLDATASFLDLRGDCRLLARLIDGFQEGKWRQSVEQ